MNDTIIIMIFGLIFFSSFSISYAQTFELQGSTISSGGTNSTSSGSAGFRLLSTIGGLAGILNGTGFQLFAGFLPTTQGGNAIPTDLISGISTCVTASDGTISCPLGQSSSGTIDFTDLYTIATPGTEDQITTDRDFSFPDAGTLGAAVLIPGGTTITADTANWNGDFTVPLFLGTTVSAPGGDATTLAFRIGSSTIDFTLNHPIRLTFTGKAGENVASINKNSVTTEITTVCNGVDFATVDAQLSEDQACKINSNGDLIVWTQRLSTFISFVRESGGPFRDVEGPSLSQDFVEGENPLVIGDTAFPKVGFYNEKTKTATVNIGTQVPFRVLMNENMGPQNVQHVALYMNLYGITGTEVHKSDTWMVFEKNGSAEIHDPQGFIGDAYTSTATKGNKFETSFYITFAKPMQTSNLIIIAWDNDRNGLTSTVLDAFKVIDPNAKSKLNEITKETTSTQTLDPEPGVDVVPEPGVDVVPEPGVDVVSPTQKETIQKWAGFHVVSASDSDLFSALNINVETESPPTLPKWTKNTLAKWALDEKISMKEFANAVKYFVKK